MNERFHLAMPNYVCTLNDLPRDPKMADVVLKAAQSIKSAIAALHKAQFLHCDIKPSNCFISSGGNIVLGDYRSVVPFNRVSNEIIALATPEYVPSEVIKQAPSTYFDYALLAATLADLSGLFVPKDKRFSLFNDASKPQGDVYTSIWNEAKIGFPMRSAPALISSLSITPSPVHVKREECNPFGYM